MGVTHSIIRRLARYSEGCRLAVEHGPTAGVVMEYAYNNQPHGRGALGRSIDRRFLQLPVWTGARQRLQTTKDLVAELLQQRRAAGLPMMILDVASATGRYLRELARERGGEDLIIVCHDRNPRQVMHGRELLDADPLPRFTFSVGDATDDASYLTRHDPDLILAIDLFPCLAEDSAVRAVMRLAFEHLGPRGCFVCTTLTQAPPSMRHWYPDDFETPLTLRPPDRIAGWLREAHYIDVEQRFSQAEGTALIAWKGY